MYASKLNVYSTMPFLSLKKLKQIMEKFMSIVCKVYLVVQLSVLPI
jgi:hypothetical protein